MTLPCWTAEASEAWQSLQLNPDRDVLAGTGHRPPRLGLPYGQQGNRILTSFLVEQLERLPRPERVVTGGAQGLDQCLAHASHLLGIPYWVAIPFQGFDERWPNDARKRLWALRDKAEKVVTVCPGGYAHAKFISRDKFLVDCATRMVALYDGESGGGTAATVKLSRDLGRPVTNLWAAWTRQ